MIPLFNALEFGIVVAIFAVITVLGFMAVHWQRAPSAAQHRRVGPRRPQVRHLVTWFLLGGDLYTAYTFVAVPALLYGTGAIGFFAVPYTIVVYPIVMFAAARPDRTEGLRHQDDDLDWDRRAPSEPDRGYSAQPTVPPAAARP